MLPEPLEEKAFMGNQSLVNKTNIKNNEPETKAIKTFPFLGTILSAILLLLAGNTLFQLQLGKEIHNKAVKLEEKLTQSAGYSEKMNSQLSSIEQLNEATNRLQKKLTSIKSNTVGMHAEIADLDKIVAEIALKVGQIDTNTKATREQLLQIAVALQANMTLIEEMTKVNGEVIASLRSMEKTQTEINQNLAHMNEKTKLLEQTSFLSKLGLSP